MTRWERFWLGLLEFLVQLLSSAADALVWVVTFEWLEDIL